MGSLFEFGMAYFQAKQRRRQPPRSAGGRGRLGQPAGGVPHRYLSGKLAVQAFLEAMKTL